jgi:ketosteroid isomerase-like protein
MVGGDVSAARAAVADDCRFLIAGDMPYSGWKDVAGFFRQMLVLPLAEPIRFIIGDVVAQDDRVWMEAESHSRLTNGQPYRNYYVFLIQLRDGKVVEYKEFVDTLHVYRVIDSPAVRGEPIPREGFVTRVNRTIVGVPIAEQMRARGETAPPYSGAS